MRRIAWWGVALVLVLVAAVILMGPDDRPGVSPEAGGEAAERPDAASLEGGPESTTETTDGIERANAEVADSTAIDGNAVSGSAGDLHIQVLHHSDESPVPHALVRLHLWGAPNPYANARIVRADESGRIELPVLGVGRFLATLFQNDEDRGYARGELEPGKVTEVTLVLEPGLTIGGVVLDHNGNTVADAGVWVIALGFDV